MSGLEVIPFGRRCDSEQRRGYSGDSASYVVLSRRGCRFAGQCWGRANEYGPGGGHQDFSRGADAGEEPADHAQAVLDGLLGVLHAAWQVRGSQADR